MADRAATKQSISSLQSGATGFTSFIRPIGGGHDCRDKAGHAGSAIQEEIEKLLQEGIADQELEEARSYILGSDALRRETLRQWSDLLSESVLFGLKTDDPARVAAERYRALSKSDIEAAARRHLKPQDLHLTFGWPKTRKKGRGKSG